MMVMSMQCQDEAPVRSEAPDVLLDGSRRETRAVFEPGHEHRTFPETDSERRAIQEFEREHRAVLEELPMPIIERQSELDAMEQVLAAWMIAATLGLAALALSIL
jgi:hypothetical protein